MAVEIVRLVRSTGAQPRLAVASIESVLRDRRAAAIERAARAGGRSVDTPFAGAFASYLAPFSMSSRLWTTQCPIVPSALFDATRSPPELPELARLSGNLASAHRSLRRCARRVPQRHLARDVHSAVAEATFRPELANLLRSGDMAFRSGSIGYLMPTALDAARTLKVFAAQWRCARTQFPIVGPLVAALHLSFVHPFVDGNGRSMRAFAAAFGPGEIDALSNTIACFLQGRQRLWNFTLPLALDGDRDALWRHIETSLESARALRTAVARAALLYRDNFGLADFDVRKSFDAALVRSATLDDRTYQFLAARASRRVADAMREAYTVGSSADGAMQWINSGANALVDGLTGPLMRQS